jgi:hypothetical protein
MANSQQRRRARRENEGSSQEQSPASTVTPKILEANPPWKKQPKTGSAGFLWQNFGTIIGIISVAFPLSWWVRALLLGTLGILLAVGIWREARMRRFGGLGRGSIALAAVGLVLYIGWHPIVEQYHKEIVPHIWPYNYGANAYECEMSFNPAELQSFKDKYKLGLACMLPDVSIDEITNPDIAISKPITIGNQGQVAVNWTGVLAARLKTYRGIIDHVPFLIPKETNMANIVTIADIKRNGGIFLNGEGDPYALGSPYPCY